MISALYVMKMKIITIILILLTASVVTAGEWTPVGRVIVDGDTDEQIAYLDPKKDDQIIIYPACILIQRNIEKVTFPNCYFKPKGKNLKFDEKSGIRLKDGYLIGVAWGDLKTDISLFSKIFRKPKFKRNEVSVYDNGIWYKVEGL